MSIKVKQTTVIQFNQSITAITEEVDSDKLICILHNLVVLKIDNQEMVLMRASTFYEA